MPIITVTLPNDGDNADASTVDNPINAILAVLNGHLDSDNLADGGIPNSKLAGGITVDKLASSTLQGWSPISAAPNSVTANGGRNYSLVFNALDLSGILSNGMRLKLTRSVTAPTQCASLNGSNQYFSCSSVTGVTFTDDFVCSALVYLTAYANETIVSRYNGTSGWSFDINSSGQISLTGFNAGSSNVSAVTAYQSLPLNRWIHVSAQLDMSSFATSPTASYMMIDGQDVACGVSQSGTNPTSLIQAGNIEVGSRNGGTLPFSGKIAQVAVYGAKVTQASILATIGQTLVGTETSIVAAYKLSNSVSDLTANANNLTAQNSATTTNADSPFAGGANALGGYTAGTTEFGEVFDVSFSTNTTVVVQVPRGYALPTSGGISVAASSTAHNPLGWPGLDNVIATALMLTDNPQTATSATIALGLTVTGYIPKNRRARFICYSGNMRNGTASKNGIAYIYIGGTNTSISGGTAVVASNNFDDANDGGGPVYMASPPYAPVGAGSVTASVALLSSSGGTLILTGASSETTYIQMELL